jgi:hypothetical protein
MKKPLHRILGFIIVFALVLGGHSKAQATPALPVTSSRPVYAYYYLWWSTRHWQDKLGSNYPYTASPLPLPATTDADGCSPTTNYAGNQLLDVPAALFSQSDPGVIENDIRTAKAAGITGFWFNWTGNGTTSQTRTSVTYTSRLAEGFAASSRVGGFTNWVSYESSSMPSADYIINDLNFLYAEFNAETTWQKMNGKPIVVLTGSRKYDNASLTRISNAVRGKIFLFGDESRSSLTDARMALFDGIYYYWSSQDPYGNPQSFNQVKEIGDRVHAAGKLWYAPFTPGFNTNLLTGSTSCVPRKNGDTMRTLYNGNAGSNPDGWGLISWNEIGENSHIMPLQKWGNTYVNVVAQLISGGTTSPTATPTRTLAPTATPIVNTPTPTLVAPTPTSSTTARTYDDKDSAFTYSSAVWQSTTTSNAYNGSYKESTTEGSYITLPFTGQSFSIIYKGGITYSKLDVFIDGVLVGTLDEKLSAAAYQKRWDYAGQFPLGQHTLKLVCRVTSSTVNRCSLDAVVVR